MGAGQSQPSDRKPSRGLHILRVTPSSPASQTDLEPFFDFVVGLEGSPFTNHINASELERIVESHENIPVNLLVWSSKTQQTRLVTVVPSRVWSAREDSGVSSTSQPSLLGLSMRLCEPEFALDNVWHVLDVLEGSPAESAGLVPYGDWIVGWSGSALQSERDFYDLVEAHVDKPLRVYVYSYDFDTLREVVLVPNRQWGGEGLLGCVFGFGLLHRIPISEPGQKFEDLVSSHISLDEGDYEEQALFVPADTIRDNTFSIEDDFSHPQQQSHESHEDLTLTLNRGSSPSENGFVAIPTATPTATPTADRSQLRASDTSVTDIRHSSGAPRQSTQDGSDGDDEDDDGVSIEETTGSITSVD